MRAFIFIFSVCFTLCSARSAYYETTVGPETLLYNAFAIQWKPQICYKSTAPNCHNEAIPNITIHGIWPNAYDGNHPAYCSGPELQYEDVEHIKNELDIYWPSLKSSNTNFGFWSYEWNKHGTCWYIVNATEYFTLAVAWMETEGYNEIQYILAANGIYASNENIYRLGDVTNALNEGLAQKTVVRCKSGKYIKEFFVCRDWFGAKMDCPDILYSNCKDEVILSEQVLPYTTSSASTTTTTENTYGNSAEYNAAADDLMVINKVTYDSSYNIQMFLLIIFIIIALWIFITKFKQFKQKNGYKEIENNGNNNVAIVW